MSPVALFTVNQTIEQVDELRLSLISKSADLAATETRTLTEFHAREQALKNFRCACNLLEGGIQRLQEIGG